MIIFVQDLSPENIYMAGKVLINEKNLQVKLHRLSCQLIENHNDFEQTVLIGLQPRGIYFANRLLQILKEEYGKTSIQLGALDTTFFRDDFRRRDEPIKANQTNIDFLVEGKRVVFIDDVLFTGRSIRAALDAIQSFGRPKSVELMVMIDRRFSRDLPIQPDYTGARVDAIDSEKVVVHWKDSHGEDVIKIVNDQD